MSEVKRYDISAFGGMSMDECSDGAYVNYEDYASLEAKCTALAEENAGLKSKGREVLNEACKVYDKFNANVDSDSGDFMDGQTLHEFQFVLDVETPATDAFLAEIERKAIRKFINSIEHILRDKLSPYDTEEMLEAMRIFLEEQSGEQK